MERLFHKKKLHFLQQNNLETRTLTLYDEPPAFWAFNNAGNVLISFHSLILWEIRFVLHLQTYVNDQNRSK